VAWKKEGRVEEGCISHESSSAGKRRRRKENTNLKADEIARWKICF
jgi:hypothetical protein